MGRTRRKRRSKKNNSSISLENQPSVVGLKKWMKLQNAYNPSSLKLTTFAITGRGLSSHKKVLSNEVLMRIPYQFMITSTTLDNSFLNEVILTEHCKSLTIHEVLSIFLILESHKGKKSEWKSYIDSLPVDLPLLPWLSTNEEIELIPEEICTHLLDKLHCFEISWKKSFISINPNWKCKCCNKYRNELMTYNSFLWAYVMVNTRCVYVNPEVVKKFCPLGRFTNCLSDEPSMALCPYLDMFNHSNVAETRAELIELNGQLVFQLTTLTSFQKHKEIFISYGHHDNIKLLCEYGFYIPADELNSVTITFNDILKASGVVNQKQYKFVRNRHLDKELNITVTGLSYNLKAILFVVTNSELLDWCSNVFTENYSDKCLLKIFKVAKNMLHIKITELSKWISNFNGKETTASFKNLLGYLEYKLLFMERLLDTVFPKDVPEPIAV